MYCVCQKETTLLYTRKKNREQFRINFKGPFPSTSKNWYLLTMQDEYLHFPFAFECLNMTTGSVIKCLSQIFIVFGMTGYINFTRGTSFITKDLCEYLTNLGIAISQTTPYHPLGNGQCKLYNGII